MDIRTVCPNNNKYYITTGNGGYNMAIQGSPTKRGADVLSNCVGYANGRFAEIIGKDKIEYQLICNAEGFIIRAKRFGLSISNVPTLGGIMVWEGKGSLAGHVAIVERIDDYNKIFTSESAYGGTAFYNKTRSNSNNNWGMGSNYVFLGCVINPSNPSSDVIKYIQETLNKTYNSNLTLDGKYGPNTHRELVRAFQHELNINYNANLKEDGIFGPNTKSKCPILKNNDKGMIVWIMQCMLYCKTYYLKDLDGIFGPNTERQVRAFQQNNNLKVDGLCGPNTDERLYS